MLKDIRLTPTRVWCRLWGYLGLGLLILFSCLVGTYATSLAADPPNQPFDLIYTIGDVKYDVYQQGLGMFGKTTGTLDNVNLPGTAVVKAYLIWAGIGRDNQIQFQRDNGTPQTITADWTWNNDTYIGDPLRAGDTWNCCGNELSVYATDITTTSIVTVGNHSYTVSDMSIEHTVGTDPPTEENWGFNLIVVYEDPTLVNTRGVVIKLGNDGLFYNWSGLLGPHSDVQCFAFPPADVERIITYNVLVGGVENAMRPNALWGMTSRSAVNDFVDRTAESGTWTQNQGLINLPPAITGVAGAIEIDGPEDGVSPFADRNGDEWDDFPRLDRPLPANHDWGCLQIESSSREQRPTLPVPGPGTQNLSASVGFVGFVAVAQIPEPDIDIIKLTNGQDANDPNGAGVPVIAPGDPVTWTYAVTNTGTVTIPQAAITVTDNVEGNVTFIANKGDGDAFLAPAEVWTYRKIGTAINLAVPPSDANLVLDSNACRQGNTGGDPSTAYTNVGTVTIPNTTATDPASYCNPPPTALEESAEPQQFDNELFIPLLLEQ